MKWVGVAVAGIASLCACSESVPFPVRAARVEQRECAGTEAQDDLRALEAMTVVSAQSKCQENYCSGGKQVFGVKLVLRQPAGVSAEQLARTLRCHNASVFLGRVDASQLPDDPYWLPDSWVDIDVRAEAGMLVVTLVGDTVEQNIRLLRRATAFAAAHGPRPGP